MREDSFTDPISDYTFLDEKFEIRCWEIPRLVFTGVSCKQG